MAKEGIPLRFYGTMPTPDRWLDSRTGLTLSDSIASADATVKKFPCISMARADGASTYYVDFGTDQTGDWTIFILFMRKTSVTEARAALRIIDYNMFPVAYIRDAPAANFSAPLSFPPSYPTIDWSEVQILGLKLKDEGDWIGTG